MLKSKHAAVVLLVAIVVGLVFTFIPIKKSYPTFDNQAEETIVQPCFNILIDDSTEYTIHKGVPFTNRIEFYSDCSYAPAKNYYGKMVADFIIGAGLVLIPSYYYLNRKGKRT